TTTNSTRASTSRRTISLAKCCILHGLLHDQAPALVLIGSLLRCQRQHQVEQGVIEVSLMPAIITNRRRKTLVLFHGCLLNSPYRPVFRACECRPSYFTSLYLGCKGAGPQERLVDS